MTTTPAAFSSAGKEATIPHRGPSTQHQFLMEACASGCARSIYSCLVETPTLLNAKDLVGAVARAQRITGSSGACRAPLAPVVLTPCGPRAPACPLKRYVR